MGMICRFLIAACLLAGHSSPFSTEVQRFVVSQAYPKASEITAFVDVVDADGQVPSNVAPANFSGHLGTNPLTVTRVRQFETSEQGVAYAFLVDISRSISRSDFGLMQAAMNKWIGSLRANDRAAICTFGDQYSVVNDFTADKQQLTSAVMSLAPRDSQTHLYQAVRNAMEFQHRVDPSLPPRRVVVLMSDGKDEGSAITSGDVVHDLRIGHIPIYAIGYSRLPRAQRRQYLDVLGRFAELSGGLYQDASASNLEQVYASIQRAILRILILDLTCPHGAADGRSYPLQITFSQDGRSLTSSLEVVPSSSPPPERTRRSSPNQPQAVSSSKFPSWLWISMGLAILVVLIFAGFRLRKRQRAVAPEPATPEKPSSRLAKTASVTDLSQQPAGKGTSMQLAVVAGKDKGRVYKFQLKKTLVIGRAKDCDVVLNDPRISKRHAEMELSKNCIVIYDLDSKNSTYVNGVPVRGRHKLDNEDCLLMGETELRLRFDQNEILTG